MDAMSKDQIRLLRDFSFANIGSDTSVATMALLGFYEESQRLIVNLKAKIDMLCEENTRLTMANQIGEIDRNAMITVECSGQSGRLGEDAVAALLVTCKGQRKLFYPRPDTHPRFAITLFCAKDEIRFIDANGETAKGIRSFFGGTDFHRQLCSSCLWVLEGKKIDYEAKKAFEEKVEENFKPCL